MNPPFDDPAKVQRWFAIECNNAAWDVIEGDQRSSEALETLLHTAHASCWHWSHAGTPVNHLRALSLLTYAYLSAGVPERALHYARECMRVGESNPEGLNDFDRAMVYGGLAKALAISGDSAAAESMLKQGLALAEALADQDDRDTALKLIGIAGASGVSAQ